MQVRELQEHLKNALEEAGNALPPNTDELTDLQLVSRQAHEEAQNALTIQRSMQAKVAATQQEYELTKKWMEDATAVYRVAPRTSIVHVVDPTDPCSDEDVKVVGKAASSSAGPASATKVAPAYEATRGDGGRAPSDGGRAPSDGGRADSDSSFDVDF